MTSRLWRISPRVSSFASLTEQVKRDRDGASADDEVSVDLFFGPDQGNEISGAFSIAGVGNAAFVSQSLVGPSPGILPSEWFRRDDVRRIVLVELDYYTQVGSGTSAVPTLATKYLATAAYFDDEDSRVYRDCVRSIPRYRRSLDRSTLRGRFQSSMGVMVIDNPDGLFDDLLTVACDGSEVRFYIGDETWNRSDFIYVFSATPTKVEAPKLGTLEITLKDNSALLDIPVGGTQSIGGTGPNANQVRPYLLGLAHNVECVLNDYATLDYVHSEDRSTDGTGQSFFPYANAVRDKGLSVGYDEENTGSVRLHAPPAGTVTADVLRLGTGRSALSTDYLMVDTPNSTFRLSNIFHSLYVNTYGLNDGPLSSKFRGALPSYYVGGLNDYYVGFIITESMNLWSDLTDKLCETGNCFVAFQRDGYLVYGRIRPDALDYLTSPDSQDGVIPVTDTIYVDDLLGATDRDPAPVRVTKLEPSYYEIQGYANKNWTPQTEFAATVSATDQAKYRRDGYNAASYRGEDSGATAYLGSSALDSLKTAKGGAPQLYHKTMTRLQNVETLISCYSDADADTMLGAWEAVRRAQFLPWVEFVDFTVDLSFYQLELGDIIGLDLTENDVSHYGYDGTLTQIVDIDISLTDFEINLGVVRRRPAIDTY